MFNNQRNANETKSNSMSHFDNDQQTVEHLNYNYNRTKVSNLPIKSTILGDMFFVYIHVTGIIKKKRIDEEMNVEFFEDSYVDREERVIHFHLPTEKIPKEYESVKLISDGDWSYHLTEEEYLRLVNPELTSDTEYILYNLDRKQRLQLIEPNNKNSKS